jgi:hypothetical protein
MNSTISAGLSFFGLFLAFVCWTLFGGLFVLEAPLGRAGYQYYAYSLPIIAAVSLIISLFAWVHGRQAKGAVGVFLILCNLVASIGSASAVWLLRGM